MGAIKRRAPSKWSYAVSSLEASNIYRSLVEIASKCSKDVITDVSEDKKSKNKFFDPDLLEVLVLVAEVSSNALFIVVSSVVI